MIDKNNKEKPYNTSYCSFGIYASTNCNYSEFQAKVFRGFWVGYDRGDEISENSLITGYCPEGYCNQTSTTWYPLPSNASKSNSCMYGPVLYVLLELLPITIVFVIIFFDVPITSGAANGFVLFCHVVETLQV